MGPTSLDVGGRQRARRSCPPPSHALQWGRHLSMSEGRTSSPPARRSPTTTLQWGRHLSMSEGNPTPQSWLIDGSASMGPTSLDVGGFRIERRGHASRRRSFGFNGADISRCRRAAMTRRLEARRRASLASMGPTSLDVGGSDARDGPASCTDAPGFNGADISRCRRGAIQRVTRRRTIRFNGADISRCRRGRRGHLPFAIGLREARLQWGRHLSMSEGSGQGERGTARSRRMSLQWGRHLSMSEGLRPFSLASVRRSSRLASMGPTSLDVGGAIDRCVRAWVPPSARLQWGRHLSMSEGCVLAPKFGSLESLQWGRHLSMSEGGVNSSEARYCTSFELQWGRHLSMSEGRGRTAASRVCADVASMGPTSLDVGGPCKRGAVRRNALDASMGPTSLDVGGVGRRAQRGIGQGRSRASMGPTSLDVGGVMSRRSTCFFVNGFNGADISRCRRGMRVSSMNHVLESALQWGRHLSMSEGRGVDAAGEAHRALRLQWGRHLSMSEGVGAAPRPHRHVCFNGADISRCRRVSSVDSSDCRRTCFNGADISRCRRERSVTRPALTAGGCASMGPTSLDVGGS